ncbi:5-azacytidine induced 1 [Perkinsus olseni]|uniref:5-azacytidine induced 1 n=1 Tax=Perkinsus olseni TaxID=32597 RepID=A0A7J6PCL2_PEROL|nr:5-azacytidine induced 1 [Perkinsus olseni]
MRDEQSSILIINGRVIMQPLPASQTTDLCSSNRGRLVAGVGVSCELVLRMLWWCLGGGLLTTITLASATDDDYDVLYNSNLPLAISISKTTIEGFDPGLATCSGVEVSRARAMLDVALKETEHSVTEPLPGHLREAFDTFYVDHTTYGKDCPQAVMASCLIKTEHILQNVLKYSEREAKRDNAAFVFDIWETYYFYKYWLFDIYYDDNGDATVALDRVYQGWPLHSFGKKILRLYRHLWSQTFDTTNYCQCVEGYDYTLTMQGTLDTLFSGVESGRLSLDGLLSTMSDQTHCVRWQRESSEPLFWLQSLKSECVPGALLDFLTCWLYWLNEGHLGAILNIAETMAQLTTLATECLDDDVWAFHSVNTVLYNFARVAKAWGVLSSPVQVRDHTGRVIADAHSDAVNLSSLVWSPYPAADAELLSLDGNPIEGLPEELSAATENARVAVTVHPRDQDAATLRVVLLYVKLIENDMTTLTPRFTTSVGHPDRDLLKEWYGVYGPILSTISDLPPLLFTDRAADACYPSMRWGADDVRADRLSRNIDSNTTIRVARKLREALLGPGFPSSPIGGRRGFGCSSYREGETRSYQQSSNEQKNRLYGSMLVAPCRMVVAAVIELVAAEVPTAILTCSGKWNKDRSPGFSIYGGMARLVGVHHICLRMRTRLRDVLSLQDVSGWRSWDIWADYDMIASALRDLRALDHRFQQKERQKDASGEKMLHCYGENSEEVAQQSSTEAVQGSENRPPNQTGTEVPSSAAKSFTRHENAAAADSPLGSIISLIELAEEKSETVLEGIRGSGRESSTLTLSTDGQSPPGSVRDSARGGHEAKLHARISTLTAELAEKTSLVCELRQRVEDQEHEWLIKMRDAERQGDRKIQTVKRELMAKGERQLKMIDKLLVDKTELTRQCEQLVSKQKKIWMAQEKLRRSEWEATKTKEIKESTIRGLEPEVERILSEGRKEKQALLERHREALEAQRAELLAQHSLQIEMKTEAIKKEYESLLMVERDRARRQVTEEAEKWNEQLRLLRSSTQQEIAEMRARAEEERNARDIEFREQLHQARVEEHKRLKEVEVRYEEELGRLKAAQEGEVKAMKREEQLEREAWMENIRGKLDDDLKEKAKEIRRECEEERDRQVAVVVDRLSREVVEAEHRAKASTAREWGEQEAGLLKDIEDLRTKVEGLEKEREGSLSVVKKLKGDMETSERELELARESLTLAQQERKDMLLAQERERGKALVELEGARRESIDEREQLRREKAQLEGELAAVRSSTKEKIDEQQVRCDEAIRTLEGRVRRMLKRKDEVIEELRGKLTSAEAFAGELDGIVSRQREEIRSLTVSGTGRRSSRKGKV